MKILYWKYNLYRISKCLSTSSLRFTFVYIVSRFLHFFLKRFDLFPVQQSAVLGDPRCKVSKNYKINYKHKEYESNINLVSCLLDSLLKHFFNWNVSHCFSLYSIPCSAFIQTIQNSSPILWASKESCHTRSSWENWPWHGIQEHIARHDRVQRTSLEAKIHIAWAGHSPNGACRPLAVKNLCSSPKCPSNSPKTSEPIGHRLRMALKISS